MALTRHTFQELRTIVGPENITRAEEELLCYSYDSTGISCIPDAVVFPSTTEQVSAVLGIASRESIPVIPRGSGSGMTGGTLPVMGGIVMGMSRMNAILSIDRDNFKARVQPGVITGIFQKAVEQQGLFYPPDPASSSFCTLGGNIGECAGGPRAVKYGVTRDYVLGLEAVLVSGQVIHTGVETSKGVAGYDLTRLIVGSEGTLAVVTAMTLRLLPLPEAVSTMVVIFDSIKDAAQAVSAIIRETVTPRCVEFLDRASIDCVRNEFPFELPESSQSLLILEVDGSADQTEKDARQLRQFCLDRGATQVILARDPSEAAGFWKARKAMSPALFKMGPHKINEDIVVPITEIPAMIDFIDDLRRSTGLAIVGFGHAGDGNIHCNIMHDKNDPIQREKAEKAVDDLFHYTLKLGGTITGEHGVGITKKKYLSWEVGAVEIELMRNIKKVFDPDSLLNPGKIF